MAVSAQFGLHQLIYEPTHLLEYSPSCIDLIFTSQLNFMTKSSAHPILPSNSHNRFVFAKPDLEILYSLLY